MWNTTAAHREMNTVFRLSHKWFYSLAWEPPLDLYCEVLNNQTSSFIDISTDKNTLWIPFVPVSSPSFILFCHLTNWRPNTTARRLLALAFSTRRNMFSVSVICSFCVVHRESQSRRKPAAVISGSEGGHELQQKAERWEENSCYWCSVRFRSINPFDVHPRSLAL